jgi:hypothetical protein
MGDNGSGNKYGNVIKLASEAENLLTSQSHHQFIFPCSG